MRKTMRQKGRAFNPHSLVLFGMDLRRHLYYRVTTPRVFYPIRRPPLTSRTVPVM
jgi:hypothetical protein